MSNGLINFKSSNDFCLATFCYSLFFLFPLVGLLSINIFSYAIFYSSSYKALCFPPWCLVFYIFSLSVVWFVFIYDYFLRVYLIFFYLSLSLVPWHKPSKNDDFCDCFVDWMTSKSSESLLYCYSRSILSLIKFIIICNAMLKINSKL